MLKQIASRQFVVDVYGDTFMSTRLSLVSSIMLLVVAAFAVFTPVLYKYTLLPLTDYTGHYSIAAVIQMNGIVFIPHVLYHVLIIGLKSFFPLLQPYEISTLLIVSIKALLGVVLFMALRANLPRPTRHFQLAALVLMILIFTPVYLSYSADLGLEHLLMIRTLGYLNYTNYHNPTQNLMLIFAVPVSLLALRAAVPQPFRS
ncbi:MAG: hypothetical protein ACK4P1_06300, partial [Aggregatilineales bacterium]